MLALCYSHIALGLQPALGAGDLGDLFGATAVAQDQGITGDSTSENKSFCVVSDDQQEIVFRATTKSDDAVIDRKEAKGSFRIRKTLAPLNSIKSRASSEVGGTGKEITFKNEQLIRALEKHSTGTLKFLGIGRRDAGGKKLLPRPSSTTAAIIYVTDSPRAKPIPKRKPTDQPPQSVVAATKPSPSKTAPTIKTKPTIKTNETIKTKPATKIKLTTEPKKKAKPDVVVVRRTDPARNRRRTPAKPAVVRRANRSVRAEITTVGMAVQDIAPSPIDELERPQGEDISGAIGRVYNPCGSPGIAIDMASTVSEEGRPWLSIQPQLGKGFETQPPPSSAKSKDKFGSFADAEPVGRGCPRFDIGTEYVWAAPVFYHQPLYFEQVALERYGHSHCNWHIESVISAAHFFAAIPILPYKIGAEPVCSRIYTYGRGRPGNCNPTCRENLPWSWRGFVFQGIATPGFVAIFP